jgi:hypothetical protein
MVSLAQLWLPIVLSAVIVFVASSIIWMATPLHKHDYKNPGAHEGTILNMIKSAAMAPGVYYVPWCHGKEKDPEVMERMKTGPWAMLTVMPEGPSMGKMLGLWFAHLLIVGVLVAYITGHAGLPADARYMGVFRVAGATSFLAYAGYAMPMAIWHGMPWSQVPGRIIDGLIYSLLTAGTFAGFWPDAPGA